MRSYLAMFATAAFLAQAAGGALAAEPRHKPHVTKTHVHKTRHHAHGVHRQKGRISYYHPKLEGKTMANGETFHTDSNAAASKVLPLGTKAKVTNLKNGKSETVEVKDRGPEVPGRVMDVSPEVANKLDMKKDGTVPAEITPVGQTAGAD